MAYKHAIDQQRAAALDELAAQARSWDWATEVNRFNFLYDA